MTLPSPGTDHTREYVPFLFIRLDLRKAKNLPLSETFADIGATIAENFNVTMPKFGTEFPYQIILNRRYEVNM